MKSGAPKDFSGGALDTRLREAVTSGSAKAVQELIKLGCDVNARDEEGDTPLHWATTLPREEGMRLLKSFGGLVPYGAVQAVSNGETARALVAAGADPDSRNKGDRTPLHLAAATTDERMVKALIEAGADCSAADVDGSTPLHLAAKGGVDDNVRALIKAGAACNATDKLGRTPLDLAHDGEIVLLLVEAGARCLATDTGGSTPLDRVAYSRDLKAARALLQAGANPNGASKDGVTPLHMAGGSEEIVRLLLEAGADCHAKESRQGATPLHWWAESGHENSARALIKAGADCNARDDHGRTPLHVAHRRMVRTLLEGGADLEAQDRFHCTPLHRAAYYGPAASVLELLSAGASIEAPTVGQLTPLHLAVLGNKADVVRLLLDAGADSEARTEDGLTPLDLATLDQDDIAERLRTNVAPKEGERRPAAPTGSDDQKNAILEMLRKSMEGRPEA